jgi:hypothetical protein
MPRHLAAPIVLAFLFAACSGGGATPSPSVAPKPSPTAMTVPVATEQEAANRVVATDPRFAGALKLSSDLIGQSRWWEAEQVAGGWRIKLTIGWGDCPSGCIERHTWTYLVRSDGAVTLEGETGDPVPPSLPA